MRVLDGLADQRTRSAPRKRLLHEQMAVGGLSLQRDKQMPGLDLPGIKRNATRNKPRARYRSEEHTSELQSLMRISYAVFCLKKKTHKRKHHILTQLLNTKL